MSSREIQQAKPSAKLRGFVVFAVFVFSLGGITLPSGQSAQAAGADQQAPGQLAVDAGNSVIPRVQSWQSGKGQTVLRSDSRIVVDQGSADKWTANPAITQLAYPTVSARRLLQVAQAFAADLKGISGLDLPVVSGTAPKPSDISFVLSSSPLTAPGTTGVEGYSLSMSAAGVGIAANTSSGAFYAGRTVLQLLRAQPDHRTLANGSVLDVPDLAMRTYTMDLSRAYWTPNVIEDTIRQMGWSKQNVLVMHFDDAEYFRLNSPKYPGLADPKFSYDQAQIKKFVELGAANNVTIIPSFEFPAHTSAKAAYFHVGMDDGPLEVAPGYGNRNTGATANNTCGQAYTYSHVTPSFTMNFMNPKAMKVSQQILDEFMPWFPGPWVHLGGDEMPSNLGACPALKSYIAQNSAKYSTVGDVLADFINGLNRKVVSAGKTSIVYSGFENESHPRQSVDKNVIVQVWQGDGTSAKLKQYRKILGEEGQFYSVPARAIVPDSAGIYSSWQPPAIPGVLGAGMHVWGDDAGWAQGQFFEESAYLPRAVTADKTWNTKKPNDTLPAFEQRLRRVGASPGYGGPLPVPRNNDGRPIHAYRMDAGPFPAGTYDAHTAGSRRPVLEACGANGMTDIGTKIQSINDPARGPIKRFFGDKFTIGRTDIPGPWSYAVTVKKNSSSDSSVLLSSPLNKVSLDFEQKGTAAANGGKAKVGFTSATKSYAFDYSVPLNRWVNLVFVSDGSSTLLYADGVRVGEIKASIPLPMARFGGGLNADLKSMEIYSQALDPGQVAALPQTRPAPACGG